VGLWVDGTIVPLSDGPMFILIDWEYKNGAQLCSRENPSLAWHSAAAAQHHAIAMAEKSSLSAIYNNQKIFFRL
jgi:hypothetical protein